MTGHLEANLYRKAMGLKVNLVDLLSGVFQRHSKEERNQLLMSGIKALSYEEMLTQWRTPWCFLWCLVISVSLMCLLYLFILQGYVDFAHIPFNFLCGFSVPLTITIFYFELNIPRNISVYEILWMILFGGILSLIFTAYFNRVIGEMPVYLAPLTEEPAKLLVTCIFLRKPDKRYILNGILIGGAVGAGFAAIETLGYFTRYGYMNLFIRNLYTAGGHVLWAAIYGGALAGVKKHEKLQLKHLGQIDFIKYFLLCCLLHFLWNNYYFNFFGELKYILVMIVGWLVFLRIINRGIQEVVSLSNQPFQEIRPSSIQYGLYGISGLYKGQFIPLGSGKITLGRDAKVCQLVFSSNAAGISRKHCTVSVEGGQLVIYDEASSYGTFLENGKRLAQGEKVVLREGQRFYLGDSSMMFEIQTR